MSVHLKRRDFIRLAGAAAASGFVRGAPRVAPRIPSAPAKAGRPNVLLIAVDDLRPELSCYGVDLIRTPSIDRLAAQGTAFSRAYCAQGICNPSRVSILTGLRPDSHRVWDNQTHFRRFHPGIMTLPQAFRSHGYLSAGIGKVFHATLPDPPSWSRFALPPDDTPIYMSKETRARQVRREDVARKQGFSQSWIDGYLRGPSTEASETPDDAHWDGRLADLGIAMLGDLKRSQPFFLGIGFSKPHLPYVAPKRYWDLYRREDIPLAANGRLPRGAPPFAINNLTELASHEDLVDVLNPAQGSLALDRARLLKHGYYACVSFVDAQVGRLLDALEAEGLRDKTIVVLLGDNGFKLGEHGSWGKLTNYEIDVRAPLIVSAPGQKSPGTASAALVEMVDIYPTLCELAGFDPPHDLEGTSLTPLLEDPSRPWKSAAFNQYARGFTNRFMGRSLRTDRYRYTEWRDRIDDRQIAVELYDHVTDSGEDVNVAGDPANKELVLELKARLAAGWKAARPV
ncbi:MAG: sulfatase [Candidatus Aminicenantes bacterium]|nr:sulfatase [Candidatus Aminicenantes bacterium]